MRKKIPPGYNNWGLCPDLAGRLAARNFDQVDDRIGRIPQFHVGFFYFRGLTMPPREITKDFRPGKSRLPVSKPSICFRRL
jgi:hypothetical protein